MYTDSEVRWAENPDAEWILRYLRWAPRVSEWPHDEGTSPDVRLKSRTGEDRYHIATILPCVCVSLAGGVHQGAVRVFLQHAGGDVWSYRRRRHRRRGWRHTCSFELRWWRHVCNEAAFCSAGRRPAGGHVQSRPSVFTQEHHIWSLPLCGRSVQPPNPGLQSSGIDGATLVDL